MNPTPRLSGGFFARLRLPLLSLIVFVPLALHSHRYQPSFVVSHASGGAARQMIRKSLDSASQPVSEAAARVSREYGKLPLRFEANQGQADDQVKYVARGGGYSLFLTGGEAVLSLQTPKQSQHSNKPERPGQEVLNSQSAGLREIEDHSRPSVVRMKLAGANANPKILAFDRLQTKSNYFIGNDPQAWRSDVTNFGKVKYEAVYPGVDVVWYGTQQQIEYDLIVAPEADAGQIKFILDGARNLRIDEQGALVAETDAGDMRLLKPVARQTINGQLRDVACSYRINNPSRQIEFEMGEYDHTQALVIDPILVYSTYLGGAGSEFAYAVAVDGDGNAYVTGYTDSADFPGASQIQTTKGSSTEAFVLKVDAAGSNVVYATWIGGNNVEQAYGVAVDSTGSAYVCGYTTSTNFPLKNPYQNKLTGSISGFVTKLNPAGSALIYSTYLGGTGTTSVYGLALDNDGNTYLTGSTTSPDFPLVNPFQTTRKGSPLFTSSDAGTKWKSAAVAPNVAGVNDIEIDPKNAAIIYLATESGIFKTTDSGESWAKVGANVIAQSVSQIVIDPETTATLYAVSQGQVYKSIDSGATWNLLDKITYAVRLTIDPKTPATLYAMNQFLGLKSTDGGATWATLPPLSSQFGTAIVADIMVDPSSSSIIYAASSQGLFKTTNGGGSWQLQNLGSPFSPSISKLTISQSNPAIVYAQASSNSGLYKTTDGGGLWTTVATPYYIYNLLALTIDPTSADVAYAIVSFDGVYKTSDGGATWKSINDGLNYAAARVIAVSRQSPATLYAGTAFPTEAFVAKLNAGAKLEYSSYLGGDNSDYGYAIAVDKTGNAYIGGYTQSANFPLQNAYQPSLKGAGDGFISKIKADGSGLIWSTLLGGDDLDSVKSLAINAAGDAFVTGSTSSLNFPTVKAIQPTIKQTKNPYDAFVTRIAADGSKLDFSTYLGGDDNEYGYGIGLDAVGNIYIAGFTYSTDFPVVNALQSQLITGPFSTSDGFVTKLNADGSAIGYSTYLGGSDYEFILGLAVDAAGNAFVTGYTYSPDYPVTPNAPRKQIARADVFLTKLAINADLAITGNDQPDPVIVGGKLTYTLTVTNNGPDQTLNTVVTDTPPAGATVVSATATTGNCSIGATITCNLGSLADKGKATITLIVTPAAAGNLVNKAVVGSNLPDINPANNAVTLETKVSALPSIYGRVTASSAGGAGVGNVTMGLSGAQRPITTTGTDGGYQIAELAARGNYTVTPTRQDYVFTPPSQTFNDLQTDQRADFAAISCVFTLEKPGLAFSSVGGAGAITVNSPDVRCAWQARSNAPWIKVTSINSGSEKGSAGFTVEPTIMSRTGTITIANNTFTISQEVNACANAEFATAATFEMKNIILRDNAGRAVVKDFNGDGRLDLAFLTEDNTEYGIALMLGTAGGGFASQKQVVSGSGGKFYGWMTAADLNGDGKLDLVMSVNTTSTAGRVLTAFGNGAGEFAAPTIYEIANGVSYLALGDFNGDKQPDVAVAGEYLSSSSSKVSILLNKGGGVLNAAKVTDFGSAINGLNRMAAADFNGDGKDDLVVGGTFSRMILALSDGAGGFASPKSLSIPSGLVALQAADFSGDGKADVFLSASNGASLLRGKGDGTFETPVEYTLGQPGSIRLLEDLNRDGKFDLVGVSSSGVIVRYGRSDGKFDDPLLYDNALLNDSFNNPAVLTGDLNDDGNLDLLSIGLIGSSGFAGSATSGSNGLSVVYSNRDWSYATPRTYDYSTTGSSGSTTTVSPTSPAVADLNGDGLMDVAVIYDSQRVAVMFGDGKGNLGKPVTYFVGQNPSGLQLADFNRDGKPDLVVTNVGSSSVTIQLNNGAGDFTIGLPILTGANSRALGVADFNNDGFPDLLVKSTTSGLALLLNNSGTGSFTQFATGLAASFPNPVVATGDFNGDGNVDVVVESPDSFSNCSFGDGKFVILSGDGKGGLTAGTVRTLAEKPSSFTSADVNGDGRDDLLFVSTCNQGSGLYVMLATGAGGFADPVRYDTGKEAPGPSLLTIGEFNGDGKLDVAVSASSSSTASAGNISIMLGKGDGSFALSRILPVSSKAGALATGDFNEDGTNDLVVTRAAGGISLTLNRASCISASGALATSAASYAGRKVSAESIVALFGKNLGQSSQVAQSTPLPTTLSGVSVKVKDRTGTERLAPLFSVASSQINLLIPAGTANGIAVVSVMNGANTVASFTLEIVAVSPGLFTSDMTGTGLPAAGVVRVKADGSQSYEQIARFDAMLNRFVPVPIDFGNGADQLYLILFGSGIRNRGALTSARATIGGLSVETLYAGKQSGFDGLDQINLRLPTTLRGRGDVEVALIVDGRAANTVRINIR